jgi:glycosyltransferase involved in cell wall biosynthesis
MPAMTASTEGSQVSQTTLRVLVVTGVYPTREMPYLGTFIKTQVESLLALGIQVEVLHPRPGPVLLRIATASVRVLLKALTKRYDVIYPHYGHWCLAARMQWTTPVVASLLGSDVHGVPLPDGSQSKKGALVTRVTRWIAPRVDAVIVQSHQMKRELPGGNVFVIPTGVDFEMFYPMQRTQARAALGWDPESYYVLFGNDPRKPVKDFPLAQAAIARLRDRGIPAELAVASGLPQATVMQCINASNAILLTSKSEGSPNIVKEAMACNVPVVAVDVGDVSQVIGATEGCGVCPRDPEALAAALTRALRHHGPTTGRADIAHLDSSAVAQQVLEVYTSVIGRTRQKVMGISN